jgi:hypothetical protein
MTGRSSVLRFSAHSRQDSAAFADPRRDERNAVAPESESNDESPKEEKEMSDLSDEWLIGIPRKAT